MNRELVYGRRPVQEVIRAGRRQILELRVTERALASEPWLRDESGLRVHVEREGKLNELAAGARPLIACLDQVTDPHNLGAVCRSADGAGATGVVVTEHKTARVTPAVCRASAGAVEHVHVGVVVNLARYLTGVKCADLWVWAAAGDAATPVWSADLATGAALVFGAEGRGLRPLVRKSCDDAFSIPLAGAVESLNVSVAAGVALFEAARQRRR